MSYYFPADCTESLETNTPQDWTALNLLCNGESECMFQNEGGTVQSCEQPYQSNYLIVFYECFPGKT